MALYLSKSRYCSAVQCPKMLWMKTNMPEMFDVSVMNEAILEVGNEVGDLAMGLFGEFTEVPFGELGEMIEATSALIADGEKIIAEASFSYNGLFCSVDILKNLGDGEVEIYEVKSSTSVKDIYYQDAAYQCYVLTQLGYSVKRVCIVHINNEYTRCGELELQKLFRTQDISKEAFAMQTEVAENIKRIELIVQQETEPSNEIGEYCFKPYACGFFGYCTRHLPTPNIFDVAEVYLSKKFLCYQNGMISFKDLDAGDALTDNQRIQIEHELFDYPPHIDKVAIKKFLKKFSYPLYFLDFESCQMAVPLYDGTRPFQQIVFQYSLHSLEREGGKLEHREFLADPSTDPRRALAEQLCRDIPRDVCVVAYNMSFEKGRIKNMAELYPDLADHLMNIHDNIQDLMIPFQKKHYYSKAMQGSYSIKHVLPALFPDDPELNYHNLEGVHNGAEASTAFRKMIGMESEELKKTREHLLKYCKLDTFAMVKIWDKLNEISQ